ncbi:hypothetical protein K0M31_003545 [Melipona bicolor]|uniref:Uncharacterized protein n=1 Tax=Melipona bicolor TaxID=60889 RepID=A0AA40FZ69_9HYME|nr:hypothetical protein K0M31_003545 [Melipona bicolor]
MSKKIKILQNGRVVQRVSSICGPSNSFWNGNGVTLVMDDRKLGGILRWKIYRNATTRKRRVIHFGMKGNAKEMKNAVVRYSYRWLSR